MVFLIPGTKHLTTNLYCHGSWRTDCTHCQSPCSPPLFILVIPFLKYKATSKVVSKNASAYAIENNEGVHYTIKCVKHSEKIHVQKVFLRCC